MFKTIKALILQLILCTSVSASTFYVSPLGDDSNAGTSERMPFRVVQFAIDQMTSGDTLIILDGFYTGTLQLKSGITIRAKNPRKAIFCGAEPLTASFERHTDKIYKTRIDKPIKQLFFNDKPMVWAKWPDMQWSENWNESKKWALATKGTGPGILTSDGFNEIADLDLRGGYCFLRYGKGNSCFSRLIEAFDGDTLHWNDDNFYNKTFTGEDGRRGTANALLTLAESHVYHPVHSKFFLVGDIDLLNASGEWFVEEGMLYFYPPEGKDPNKATILTKTIDYCIFQKQGFSDLSIEGVDFFATSIKLGHPENKNIKFYNSYFTYIGTELLHMDRPHASKVAKPISIGGANISIDSCMFAGAQNSAITLNGSMILVENCVFAENGRHGNFESRAMSIRPKGTFKITRNTFFNNCSDALLISWDSKYKESTNPEVSYNNIFNAGLYNSDVSGVYMPRLSQHWTDFHHNWVHNIKGNGLRLDQAGEKLNVHHNVFWASKRGLNIEGFGNFNIYNNTSVLHETACFVTRNVLPKRKGTGDAYVSNDISFPPITDWNVLNNLVTEFVDRVGPSEKRALAQSLNNGRLHPERKKHKDIPIYDRGAIQGNLTNFDQKIFTDGTLSGLNLIPIDEVVRKGVAQTAELKAQGVTSLESFRGAFDCKGKGWSTGSDWMPYGLEVLKTIAESERFAKKYKTVSVIPAISVEGLAYGRLNQN